MAYLVTVGQMVNNVQLLGDYLVVDGNTSTDAPRAPATGTLIGWLNWSYANLWRWLTDTDEDYALTRYYLSTVQGSGTYALPGNFYKLRAVEVSPTNESVGWVPLRRASVDDNRWATDGQPAGTGNSWGYPEAYREFGDGYGDETLELLPYPSSPISVRVSYVPVPQVLSSSLQTVDAINGYDQLIVLGALIYSRAREAIPGTDFKVQYEELKAEIAQSMRKKDRYAPRRLRSRNSLVNTWRRYR